MARLEHIEDYEPLIPPSASKRATDHSDRTEEVWREAENTQRENSSASRDTSTSATLLKRAHGLSYAGIVLFTLILFLRPYEMFSWLAWASSSAFWVAILTFVVYVPTQLGVEGNLTVRPREVNLALLLVLFGLISVGIALNHLVAWYCFADFMKVILVFIVLINVIRTEKRLRSFIVLTLIISCVLAASAVNDYRMGRFVLGLHERIQGLVGNLFDNPNDLALHLVTMIPLALALLLTTKGPLRKLFFTAATALMVAGVVATFSRGGFIGLVAGGTLMAWRLSRKNRWMVAVALPVVLVAFIVLAPSGYGTRIATTADDSGVARRDELKRSLTVAIYHPIFGVGMNNYILFSDINHATHNAYTQVASEMGFPAMLTYILFLITPLKSLRRIRSETEPQRKTSRYYYFAVGMEASLIAYMCSSFFLSVAYLWYVYYLVGYAICFRRLYEASLHQSLPGTTPVTSRPLTQPSYPQNGETLRNSRSIPV